MQTKSYLVLILFTLVSLNVLAQNPFESLGVPDKDVKFLTLSQGRYAEFHKDKDYEIIGSVIIDMKNKKIAGFVDRDTLYKNANYELETTTRFFTMDRFSEKYIELTPYQYAGNNPICNVDINGDSIWVSTTNTTTNAQGNSTTQTTNYYYGQDSNGNWGFIDPSGNLYSGNNQFVNSVVGALSTIMNGGNAGNSLISNLAASSSNVKLLQTRSGNAEFQDPNNPQYDSYVKWNSNRAAPFQGQSFVSLAHELGHTQDRFNGTMDMNTWYTVTEQNGNSKAIPRAEIYATHIENQIRSENNLQLRTHYSVDPLGNGTGPRIIFNNSIQSKYYDSRGIANPNFRPIRRRRQTPFVY